MARSVVEHPCRPSFGRKNLRTPSFVFERVDASSSGLVAQANHPWSRTGARRARGKRAHSPKQRRKEKRPIRGALSWRVFEYSILQYKSCRVSCVVPYPLTFDKLVIALILLRWLYVRALAKWLSLVRSVFFVTAHALHFVFFY